MRLQFQRLLLAAVLLSSTGCATVGSSIGSAVQRIEGQYYLNKADYAGGRSSFAERLAANPGDHEANYFMARFELGDDNPQAALPFIQKAVKLAPGNADYHFWEGVAWWALMKPDKEKAAYEKALALDPDHVSANLYLAHNLLDRGQDSASLERYERTLRLSPQEPQAMFNKAVALERLGRKADMTRALHAYLRAYPDASLARQGVRMLNKAGDFTWRNHPLGRQTVALRAVEFAPGSARLTRESEDSLDRVGAMLADDPDLGLHVVAYVKGDAELARERALAVRDYVSGRSWRVSSDRLTPRWIDRPETVKSEGRTTRLAESVNIFTRIERP